MMVYRHNHTGQLYAFLCESHDVKSGERQVVLFQLETGRIYSYTEPAFVQGFINTGRDPQSDIKPEVDY